MRPESLALFDNLRHQAGELTDLLGPKLDELDTGHPYNVLSMMYLVRAIAHTAMVLAADEPDRPLKDPILILEAMLRQMRNDIGWVPIASYVEEN